MTIIVNIIIVLTILFVRVAPYCLCMEIRQRQPLIDKGPETWPRLLGPWGSCHAV